METAHQIIHSVGIEQVAERVNVKPRVVRNAANAGIIPALWYAALCDMTGRDLPKKVFSFKGMDCGNAA